MINTCWNIDTTLRRDSLNGAHHKQSEKSYPDIQGLDSTEKFEQ
jgi:hypothetical protein